MRELLLPNLSLLGNISGGPAWAVPIRIADLQVYFPGTGGGVGGITGLAPVGATPNANAATLTAGGTILNLEPASATFPGVVTTLAQTFAGDKTFTGFVAAQKSFDLPLTSSASVGVLRIALNPVLHQTAGISNIFLGLQAGNFTLGGNFITAMGYKAGVALAGGNYNSFYGASAGASVQSGSSNVAVGYNALGTSGVSVANSVAVGYQALLVASGNSNIGVGVQAGDAITTGAQNLCLGLAADVPVPTASFQLSIQNIIYGFGNSGTSATVSTGRITIGTNVDDGVTRLQVDQSVSASWSFDLPTTSSATVGVLRLGGVPLLHNFGILNVFVGGGGNFALTGQSNVVCGTGGAQLTSGGSNVLLGRSAGNLITTGNNNVMLGRNAGNNVTSANSCIAIGFGAYPPDGVTAGGMSIGNIIWGFGNTGVSNTASTGRIAIGVPASGVVTDDGVSRLQVYGDSAIAGNINITGNITAANFPGPATGVQSLGPVGAVPNANAATLTGTVLNLQPADATNPGAVTAGTQTFGGTKTFSIVTVQNYLQLANTTGATVGVLRFGGNPVMHQFGNVNNMFLGTGCGNFTLTGAADTCTGNGAGAALTSGGGNSLFGFQAGAAIQGGANNIAFGYQALNTNIAGGDNVALGTLALTACTGNQNIGIGRSAGTNLTSGAQNVALGLNVGFPSATASGQLVIQNIIYGFANTGSTTTDSTGRISIGARTDDGASKLQVYGDTKSIGNVLIPNQANYLDFGSQTRQMIDLYGGANGAHGFGVQSSTTYTRSSGGFAWFKLGTHSDTLNDPGAGGTRLMDLSGTGNLTITGNLSAANFPGASSGVTTMAAIGAAPNANAATISGVTLTMQPASASFGGVMTTGAQTIAGAKTFSGVLTANSNATVNGRLTAPYDFPGYYDNGVAAGSTATINWNNGNFQAIGVNASCTFTFSAPPAMCMLYFDIFGGGTSTLTWPATVRGSPPTSVAAGKNTVVSFLYDGSTYYYYMGGPQSALLAADAGLLPKNLVSLIWGFLASGVGFGLAFLLHSLWV